MAKKKVTYRSSGVNLAAKGRWVDRLQALLKSTYDPRVISRDKSFAGLYRLDYDEQLFRHNYRRPVLVACTDGVGTKALLAARTGRLSTLGIDLVAMNVNDMITCGAEPLFFLDYIAVAELKSDELEVLLEGIAAGCRESGCALLGGETAEMPDVYRPGEFDLAGFAVGVVEFEKQIDGRGIRPGDLLVGLPSSGIHSNGYTLVRRLVETAHLDLESPVKELGGVLADVLMTPTRIYVNAVRAALSAYQRIRPVTGMAHITGGGLSENIVRILPDGCDAVIQRRQWRPPPIFGFLRRLGCTRGEMFKVFNMGIGYVFVIRARYVQGVLDALAAVGESPIVIGRIETGSARVRWK